MRSLFKNFRCHVLTFATAVFTIGFAMLTSGTRADDRFIVPTSSSDSSSPPPSSNPGSSYSPPPSSSSNNSGSSSSDSNRFNVPVPGNSSPNGSQPGSGPIGGLPGHGGYSTYIPYWGGYYYWDGDYYYWGGHRYMSEFGSFGRYAFYPGFGDVGQFDRASTEKSTPIFFPPNVPPIGAPIPPKQAPGGGISAPAELTSFIYEPFYAPLSTRLSEQDLTKKLMTRLDNYRAKRSALQSELQNKLASLKDAMPADRIQQLETFAREQTPHIAELEATAEQLRSDLLRGGLVGLFSGTGDWNQSRNWALGNGPLAKPREQTLVYEFLVMRAAVFYQDGLSPAQRRLLREVAMELQVEAFKPKVDDSAKKENTLVYFSPETARIHVPDDLPADLSAKIAVYQSEKSAIKTELRETLYRQDKASASRRAQTLKQLAESQEPRIATLEGLADDIRAGLSRLPKPPGPIAAPAFPAELAMRISEYQKEKLAMQKMIQTKLEEIRKRYAPSSYGFKKMGSDDEKLAYRLEGRPGRSQVDTALISGAIANLNQENVQRFASLNREKEAIRGEITRYATAHPDTTGEKTVQSLLNDFINSLYEEESWQPYKDYQTAVYQPGLSPEQRRLLFEVALEKLSLPLPNGESL